MELYLIRHSQTDWNVQRRLQGKTDTLLNAYGEDIARKTGNGLKDVEFKAAFCSPLKRARQTAELILENREVPILFDKRLEEISFGIYEGFSVLEESEHVLPEEFSYFFKAPHKYEPPEGGEGFREVLHRLNAFLEELYQNPLYTNEKILICTHGATLNGIFSIMQKRTLENYWGSRLQKNCAVTIVNIDNGAIEIKEEGLLFYTEE